MLLPPYFRLDELLVNNASAVVMPANCHRCWAPNYEACSGAHQVLGAVDVEKMQLVLHKAYTHRLIESDRKGRRHRGADEVVRNADGHNHFDPMIFRSVNRPCD